MTNALHANLETIAIPRDLPRRYHVHLVSTASSTFLILKPLLVHQELMAFLRACDQNTSAHYVEVDSTVAESLLEVLLLLQNRVTLVITVVKALLQKMSQAATCRFYRKLFQEFNAPLNAHKELTVLKNRSPHCLAVKARTLPVPEKDVTQIASLAKKDTSVLGKFYTTILIMFCTMEHLVNAREAITAQLEI